MKVLAVLCFVAVAFAKREVKKTCTEKPESGMCMAYFPMWYYDPNTQTCNEFVYGGCQGNGNRYATKKECLENCEGVTAVESASSVCELPAETGLCKAYMPRFHFDSVSGQCKGFIYGGCGGNGNNFETEKDCQKACGGAVPQRALDRPDCHLKGETGLCKGSFPRFYYDQEEGMCKKFIYGGCGGNRNNFETEFDCYNKCGALLSESPCDQEKVVGPCKAAFPRFFYNKQSGKCESFIYGGCDGNGNNFGKKEQCENTCGVTQRVEGRPDCEKKGETGPCRGSFPRFYYDQEEGMCKKFIYGGCGGNMNNFETEAECQNGCGALLSESPCDQEKVVGPCKAAFPRFFFNKQSGKCESFTYGGCRGNGNNFGKKEECEKTCGGRDLQLKWRSIRDAFVRNHRAIQKKKSGDAAKNIKKYVYARQLEFLTSILRHNETEDSLGKNSAVIEGTPDGDSEAFEQFEQDIILCNEPSNSTLFRRENKKLEDKLEDYIDMMSKHIQETYSQHKDDLNFFLSLMPTMKKLSEIDKLKFRSDVLQVMLKYTKRPQPQCGVPTIQTVTEIPSNST